MNRFNTPDIPLLAPETADPVIFNDAPAAVAELIRRYAEATEFLRENFHAFLGGKGDAARFRAYYPELTFQTSSFARIDSRLSFGHVSKPGTYTTTITRPDLFKDYLETQIDLLIKNHQMPVTVSSSTKPIPVHFAFREGENVEASLNGTIDTPIRDAFDTPDLEDMDDSVVNGEFDIKEDGILPLAPFSAARVDYSLHRLAH